MKYGLMCYGYTTNLGNEIQSIAARRFLPEVDYYIDHEMLESFDEDANVKMIMNGWYLDCPKAWPPSQNIDPLLVSMHFTTRTEERKAPILSDESREFFKMHGPVGCRDFHTLEFLSGNGIDAYFTGCLTLTLDSGRDKIEMEEKDKYIVINVNNPDELLGYLRQKTDKKIYVIYQDMIPSYEKAFPETMGSGVYTLTSLYDYREKLFMAENLLEVYENAHCVVTDRLHCALPCLAFKTPVLLIKDDRMQERFDGISELLHISSFDGYVNNYSVFDVDSPPENSRDYLKIRTDLIERCEKFTGHISDSCYTGISRQESLENHARILSKTAIETRNYMKTIVNDYRRSIKRSDRYLGMIRDYKIEIRDLTRESENRQKEIDDLTEKISDLNSTINSLNEKIQSQEKQIDEITSSGSWKVTAPMRKLKKNLK